MSNCGIKICLKQGEELNRSLTIKSEGLPMDLSDYTVRVQVKTEGLEKVKPLFDKEITTVSDINEVGQIVNPLQGEVIIHFTQEDTSIPTGEYALIVYLEQYKYRDIISSNCCGNGSKFIVCEQ